MKDIINNLIKQVQQEYSPEAQEGKIIDYYFASGNKAEVVVAGCEFDIGITLQCTNNPINNFHVVGAGGDMRGREVTCIHGLNSPRPHYATSRKKYPARFYSALKQIIDGKYTQPTAGGSNITCAFNS